MANQKFWTTENNPRQAMHLFGSVLISLVIGALILSGCAGSATFRVLDAETKEPIEGAVALAIWDRAKGLPGLIYTVTAKAVEAETDAEGYFRIPAIFGTMALQVPRLKVYKPGYVGWDSRLIYRGHSEKNPTIPIYESRENFSMKNQDLYLEPWKDEYSFRSHGYFIHTYTFDLDKAGLKESEYEKLIEYEVPFRIKEGE